MAISLHGPGDDDLALMSEINVTPFIDVILVLLIIFMVAAPLSTVDVPVELPGLSASPAPRPDEPIYLTVKADLGLTLGDVDVPREAIRQSLDTLTGGDHEQRIFLRAEQQIPYGQVMQVMNLLRNAGYLKIGLVGLEMAEPTP